MYGFKQQLPKHSKAVFSESEDSGGQVPCYKIGVIPFYGILQTSAGGSKVERSSSKIVG